MAKVNESFKEVFNKALTEHGFSQSNDTDNIYMLTWNNNPERIITLQFILPEPGNESTFGIRGIQAIGNFRFRIPPPGVSEPRFYIFTFSNPCNCCVEFIIIPSTELEKRLKYRNSINSDDQKVEIIFWLMEDKSLYYTSGLGAEGRYYYIDGRMDNSTRCFTEFLNCWESLITN